MGAGMEKIAVIGMDCRYPGANNVEEFWEKVEKPLFGGGIMETLAFDSDGVVTASLLSQLTNSH